LALVDLALTGSLIVIVIFSGYENFVSRIDHAHHTDWPEWMGKIDFSGLKLKLLSSIVAISGIQLLKQFMAINSVSDRDIMWLVIVHVVFVISSVLLALSDRLAAHGDGPGKSSGHAGKGGGGGSADGGGPDGHGGVKSEDAPGRLPPGAIVVAKGGEQPGPAVSARKPVQVQVSKVEVRRTSQATQQVVVQKQPAIQKATAQASPQHQVPDEPLLPGERPPSIKRRLH
jgi:hypothetical protein